MRSGENSKSFSDAEVSYDLYRVQNGRTHSAVRGMDATDESPQKKMNIIICTHSEDFQTEMNTKRDLGKCMNFAICGEQEQSPSPSPCHTCCGLWADAKVTFLPTPARCPVCQEDNQRLIQHGCACAHGLCEQCWMTVAQRDQGCPAAPWDDIQDCVDEHELKKFASFILTIGSVLRSGGNFLAFDEVYETYRELEPELGRTCDTVLVTFPFFAYVLWQTADFFDETAIDCGDRCSEELLVFPVAPGELVKDFLYDHRPSLFRLSHPQSCQAYDEQLRAWGDRREALNKVRMNCPLCRGQFSG